MPSRRGCPLSSVVVVVAAAAAAVVVEVHSPFEPIFCHALENVQIMSSAHGLDQESQESSIPKAHYLRAA